MGKTLLFIHIVLDFKKNVNELINVYRSEE